MNSQDKYAAYRPQALKHPFPVVGWMMILRGLFTVVLAFPALAGFATAVRTGRYDDASTLLALGALFISWGGRVINSGTAIVLRFSVKPSAPSDLSERVDPHTGQTISYGRYRYTLSNLRYLFLRKELPDEHKGDLVDELMSLLGRATQPMHPMKRALVIDVLRGAAASIGLLFAFIAAFSFIQFDAAMRGQISLINLVFVMAFFWVLRYWGLTEEAWIHRQRFSIPRLLAQAGLIFLIAVMLPVLLSMLGPAAARFTQIQIPSPIGLLVVLIFFGTIASGIILTISVLQSRREVYEGRAAVAISDGPPLEFHGRVLAKDLLNAFARYIASSRSWSLDDRVYSFSETRGEGGEREPSDHAELIAESAPLIRTDLLARGSLKWTLIGTSLFGEFLLVGCAIFLVLSKLDAVDLTHRIIEMVKGQNYAGLLTIPAHPFFTTALLLLVLSRFGTLFREIGLRFLAEVVFQSYMTAISISSSILQGRNEAAVSQSDGMHLFDAGRTSTLRIRIQCAFVHSVTLISIGVKGDSLGQQRYIVGAEPQDRLMHALAEQAHRYIKQRTDAAATRVHSQTVEMKDAAQLLVDSDSEAQMIRARQQDALGNEDRAKLFLTERSGHTAPDEAEQ